MQHHLGPYEIERRLATGGMAEVFVAKRVGPHGFSKRVALKRILPQFARDADFVAMFIEEARLAARLEHPNVVQVFDFGEQAGELFLAMELVDGTNVNRVLRAVYMRGEVVPLDAALHIASQTARALSYAHQACDDDGTFLKIVHRDVSPANILLTRTGHVKLSDFGIAHVAIADRHTDDGRVRGKLGYMSPEQVMGKELDGRSDVFTLTTVLAEMLLAEPLFGDGSELDILLRIRNTDLRVLENTRRRIPSDVRRLLQLGLSRDPATRPTAAAFADALDVVIRRRGSQGHGPQRVAHLLARLELVDQRPGDHDANEPGARPTWLLRLEQDASEPDTQEQHLNGQLGLPERDIYRVRVETGEQLGPMPFPQLVRLVTAGLVHQETLISKEGGRFMSADSYPELLRFVTSPALQWKGEETSQATWRGALGRACLLPLVHRIAADRRTGLIYLDDGRRKKKIYFVDGRPEFVASTDTRELLGEYLVETGMCLRPEVEQALSLLPRYGGRLGDALVGMGVLRPVQLFRAVSSQVRQRYLEAFRWREGDWCYVPDARSNEETFPISQDAHELMRDAALHTDPTEMEAALSPVMERVLSPTSAPPVPISAYRLPDNWQQLIESVHGDTTLAGLLARESSRGLGDIEDVYRAVFLGLSCELLQVA